MTYTLKTIAMKRILIIGALLGGLFALESQAQDLRFTQYNAIPTSINPAFAGSLDEARLVSVYRNQWASMPGSYVGWHVAHDWFNRDLNSGFGMLFSATNASSFFTSSL